MIMNVKEIRIPSTADSWHLSVDTGGEELGSASTGERDVLPVSTTTFTVIVERDTDSGWFIGDVLELPGCATEARDFRLLLRNVREAIAAYRESGEVVEPASAYVGT